MYYISVMDITSLNLKDINLNDQEIGKVTSIVAGEGLEQLALYLDKEDLSLRDRILSELGMDTGQRVVTEKNHHRLCNGQGTDLYNGTRWVGRSKTGNTEHEIHQDIASDEKYEGMGQELGIYIKAKTKKQRDDSPREKLTLKQFSKNFNAEMEV